MGLISIEYHKLLIEWPVLLRIWYLDEIIIGEEYCEFPGFKDKSLGMNLGLPGAVFCALQRNCISNSSKSSFAEVKIHLGDCECVEFLSSFLEQIQHLDLLHYNGTTEGFAVCHGIFQLGNWRCTACLCHCLKIKEPQNMKLPSLYWKQVENEVFQNLLVCTP